MYTYSCFYELSIVCWSCFHIVPTILGFPTKDMTLFQTHSRGNCDESSKIGIFPSTTNWSVIWSHSFPLRFWKILKFSHVFLRQKKKTKGCTHFFVQSSTPPHRPDVVFLMFFLPVFFQALFNKKSLMDFGISRNMSTNAAAGFIASRRTFCVFFGGGKAWELTWKPAVASYYGFHGRNPKANQPGYIKKTV